MLISTSSSHKILIRPLSFAKIVCQQTAYKNERELSERIRMRGKKEAELEKLVSFFEKDFISRVEGGVE